MVTIKCNDPCINLFILLNNIETQNIQYWVIFPYKIHMVISHNLSIFDFSLLYTLFNIKCYFKLANLVPVNKFIKHIIRVIPTSKTQDTYEKISNWAKQLYYNMPLEIINVYLQTSYVNFVKYARKVNLILYL